MSTKQDSRFWIIFDVCTRPEYYLDLHNLLAIPSNTTLRYEYRCKYLSEEALKFAYNTESAPSFILLVYGQWKDYTKGMLKFDPRTVPVNEMIWIPIRLAEMQLVFSEGENFFFDFKALDYPKCKLDILRDILGPHLSKGEVPFRKFVCISDDVYSLNALLNGDNDDNWQAIVDQLSQAPIQFAGDSFWRLQKPQFKSGRYFKTIYQKDKSRVQKETIIHQITSYYYFPEGRDSKLEFISYSSPNLAGVLSRKLQASVASDMPLIVTEGQEVELRQYTASYIRIKSVYSKDFSGRVGVLTVETIPASGLWPVGPKITLRFLVKKQFCRLISGMIAAFIGFVVMVLVPLSIETGTAITLEAILFLVFGAVMLVVAVWMLRGEIHINT